MVASIECDAQHGGHLYTAHRATKMAFLENEGRVMKEVFGYNTHILSRADLHVRYVCDPEAAGALHEPDGVGVHPLKLAFGYLRTARALGVKIHPAGPVLGGEPVGGVRSE